MTSFFLIFSEHPWDKLCANLPHLQFLMNNCVYSSQTDIKLCTYCLYRHTTILIHEILYLANQLWCSDLLLPHLSSFLTDSLPSLNLLRHSKTDAQFMQDGPKAAWSIPYISVAFFPSLKQNFIAYHSPKVIQFPAGFLDGWRHIFPEIISSHQGSGVSYTWTITAQTGSNHPGCHSKKNPSLTGFLDGWHHICLEMISSHLGSAISYMSTFMIWTGSNRISCHNKKTLTSARSEAYLLRISLPPANYVMSLSLITWCHT